MHEKWVHLLNKSGYIFQVPCWGVNIGTRKLSLRLIRTDIIFGEIYHRSALHVPKCWNSNIYLQHWWMFVVPSCRMKYFGNKMNIYIQKVSAKLFLYKCIMYHSFRTLLWKNCICPLGTHESHGHTREFKFVHHPIENKHVLSCTVMK